MKLNKLTTFIKGAVNLSTILVIIVITLTRLDFNKLALLSLVMLSILLFLLSYLFNFFRSNPVNYTLFTIIFFILMSCYIFARSPFTDVPKFNHDSTIGLTIIVSYNLGSFFFNYFFPLSNENIYNLKITKILINLSVINFMSLLLLFLIFYFFKFSF